VIYIFIFFYLEVLISMALVDDFAKLFSIYFLIQSLLVFFLA